jgi:hypothetical protein
MSIAQTAVALGVSRATIYRYARLGALTRYTDSGSSRGARRIWFDADEVHLLAARARLREQALAVLLSAEGTDKGIRE